MTICDIAMLPDVRRQCSDAFEERRHPMLESNNMASQRFCLRWNNHQSNLLSVFDQLLQEQCFVDVTLAVEGRFLRAHKMVLSACSPYFQTLFTEHPDKHPIVILKDVPYADMRCLLDFMYRGEVSVNQDRLTAFLKVAETLRIKGLTEVNEDRCDVPSLTNSVVNAGGHLPPPQLHRINPRAHGYPPLLTSAPLLGSALTAPKRKRGRPRKLSGGSEVEVESDGERGDSLNLPELLEVRMDDGRDERCSNGDGDVDLDEDDLPPSTSGTPSSGINPFPLEDLLKQKMERRSSDECSMTYDYPTLKQDSLEQGRSSPYSSGGGSATTPNTSRDSGGTMTASQKSVMRRRVRRRANSNSQDPAEHLTEMSVRGLNLFRYASVHDGLYKCTECEKMEVMKTFKNKYSFQRHAFLYHEGHQRKVFPCPVCHKEFSRPDKMKNHMKTVHECFPLKDVFPPSPAGHVGYFLTQNMQQGQGKDDNPKLVKEEGTNAKYAAQQQALVTGHVAP